MDTNTEKKNLDPENSEIKISNNRNEKFYKFLSKIILKKFGSVELTSLGNTSEKSVKIANYLVNNNLATIEKINSDEIKMEDNGRNSYKFYVKLNKTDQFDKLVEGKFN